MKQPVNHDARLFDALAALAATIEPDIRRGAMFGSPALFVGRKMAACVFGNEIGLKVPAVRAEAAIAAGRATHFTPYGKPKMREWIALSAPVEKVESIEDLLAMALAYAKAAPKSTRT